MKYASINLKEKLTKFNEHWSPKVIAEMNNYQFKLVKLKDEFVWHTHPETDETFIVLDGIMTIYLHDGKVELSSGEMFVVPKGVKHKPYAYHECSIMLVEQKGTINTGNSVNEYTAKNNVWI